MSVDRALRLIAGAFVVLSVILGMYVHPGFLWFSVFVGANLFQSAFTNWCPMMGACRPCWMWHSSMLPAPLACWRGASGPSGCAAG